MCDNHNNNTGNSKSTPTFTSCKNNNDHHNDHNQNEHDKENRNPHHLKEGTIAIHKSNNNIIKNTGKKCKFAQHTTSNSTSTSISTTYTCKTKIKAGFQNSINFHDIARIATQIHSLPHNHINKSNNSNKSNNDKSKPTTSNNYDHLLLDSHNDDDNNNNTTIIDFLNQHLIQLVMKHDKILMKHSTTATTTTTNTNPTRMTATKNIKIIMIKISMICSLLHVIYLHCSLTALYTLFWKMSSTSKSYPKRKHEIMYNTILIVLDHILRCQSQYILSQNNNNINDNNDDDTVVVKQEQDQQKDDHPLHHECFIKDNGDNETNNTDITTTTTSSSSTTTTFTTIATARSNSLPTYNVNKRSYCSSSNSNHIQNTIQKLLLVLIRMTSIANLNATFIIQTWSLMIHILQIIIMNNHDNNNNDVTMTNKTISSSSSSSSPMFHLSHYQHHVVTIIANLMMCCCNHHHHHDKNNDKSTRSSNDDKKKIIIGHDKINKMLDQVMMIISQHKQYFINNNNNYEQLFCQEVCRLLLHIATNDHQNHYYDSLNQHNPILVQRKDVMDFIHMKINSDNVHDRIVCVAILKKLACFGKNKSSDSRTDYSSSASGEGSCVDGYNNTSFYKSIIHDLYYRVEEDCDIRVIDASLLALCEIVKNHPQLIHYQQSKMISFLSTALHNKKQGISQYCLEEVMNLYSKITTQIDPLLEDCWKVIETLFILAHENDSAKSELLNICKLVCNIQPSRFFANMNIALKDGSLTTKHIASEILCKLATLPNIVEIMAKDEKVSKALVSAVTSESNNVGSRNYKMNCINAIVSILLSTSDIDDLIKYKGTLPVLVTFVSSHESSCKDNTTVKKNFKEAIVKLSHAMLLDQTTV